MLGKVLKYDIKGLWKGYLGIYLLLIISAFLKWGMDFLVTQYSFLSSISFAIHALYIILLVGVFFYTFLKPIHRFYMTLMKDEGYLTHTLPVAKETLVLSKLLSSFLFLLTTIGIVFLSLLIAYGHTNLWRDFYSMIEKAMAAGQIDPTILWTGLGISLFLSYFQSTLLIITALSLGQTRQEKRLSFSFLFGFVLFLLGQFVSLIGLGISLLFQPSLISEFSNPFPSMGSLVFFFSIAYILSLLLSCFYYFLTTYLLKKKLNLE